MAQEVDRMVRGVFQDMERLGHVDLEARWPSEPRPTR
jgi:hypothetical protein